MRIPDQVILARIRCPVPWTHLESDGTHEALVEAPSFYDEHSPTINFPENQVEVTGFRHREWTAFGWTLVLKWIET